MHSLALLVAAASLGVDYGWQPAEDGQLEYIIQLEPTVLPLLKQGQEIVSEIHPDAKGVRRFRILVGKGDLPRESLPVAAPASEPEAEPEPEQPPEVILKRPSFRGAGAPPLRNDFQSEFEPGPVADEPADDFPNPPKRRRGSVFGMPDVPVEEVTRSRQPDELEPDPTVTPLKHRTVGHTEKWSNQATEADKALDGKSTAQTKPEPAKPWFPLTVTILLLFGSLGGNAYLGWLAKDFYNRYKSLAEELREPRPVND